jgi:hypothetical protein
VASPDRPYVRVYHDDLRRDYPSVYADDAALATWLRLLVLADKMWPSTPELPRSVRPKALATLTVAGLIVVDGCTFEVRGYHAERSMRQASARNAAAVRWHSGRIADVDAEVMPSPRPRPSPSPNIPPDPPKGATNRKEKPESIGSILRRAAGTQ